MLDALRKLPSVVWLIGLISFVNDSASEMVYPLVPLYLSSVLLAGPKALGLIEGAAEAAASLLKLLSGVIVDRTGRRKPWLLLGYGMASVSRPLIALIGSWPMLLALRVLDRIGKGLRTSPRDALLAASVDTRHRGLAFGLHRAMDNAGAVLGPLLAAALLSRHWPLRDLFLWTAVPAAVCVALTLLLKEPPRPTIEPRLQYDWRFTALSPALQRYLVVVALFSLGNASNMFLLLRARELGVPDAQIPLLWAAVSAVAALFSTPFAAWSDRIGRRGLLIGGYLAYAIFYALLGFVATPDLSLYALFAGYGIFMAATEGVEKALVADLSPPQRQGAAFGWFNLTTGALLLPASLLFGFLYQHFNATTAFTVAACCAASAAALLMLWLRRIP